MSDPVLLADGKFGMYRLETDPVCVQVPGEEEYRWIPVCDLTCTPEGAYLQKGFTGFDQDDQESYHTVNQAPLLAQALLMMDWERRGGAKLLPKYDAVAMRVSHIDGTQTVVLVDLEGPKSC